MCIACVYTCAGVMFNVRKLNVGDFLWIAQEKTVPLPGTCIYVHCSSWYAYTVCVSTHVHVICECVCVCVCASECV